MKATFYIILTLLTFSASAERTPSIHLDLKDLLKRTLKHSILINEKNREEARQLLMIDEIKSRFYPRLTVQNRLNWNLIKNEYTDDYDYHANLSLNWNLFGFYRNFKAIALAHENLKILYLNHSRDKLSDCISVIDLYFRYWLQMSMQELIQEDIAILKKKIAITAFYLKKGNSSESEMELLKNKLPGLQDSLQKSEEETAKIIDKIRKKLLIKQQARLLPPDNYSELPPLKPLDQDIDLIIKNSPVMLAARKNTDLAEKAYKSSKFDRWSQLNSSMYFSNSLSLDDWDWERDKENFFLGFGLSWGLPLFDAGQSKRNRERARLSYQEARQKEEELVFELKEQLDKLFDSIEDSYQKRVVLTQKFQQNEKLLSLKKIQFNNGKISENELMILKNENNSSRHTLQEAIYNEIIARLNFSALLGKLPSWLTGEELIL